MSRKKSRSGKNVAKDLVGKAPSDQPSGNGAIVNSTSKIASAPKKIFLWLAGIVVAAVAAVWTDRIKDILGSAIPAGGGIVCSLSESLAKRESDNDYVVLLSNIRNDKNDQLGSALASAIRERTGLPVIRSCKQIFISHEGQRGEAENLADAEATRLLLARNADLALWGEVRPNETKPRIFFSFRRKNFLGGRSGKLFDVSNSEQFIDREFAEALFWSSAVVPVPELPLQQKALATKLLALDSAEGPRGWPAKTLYHTAKLRTAAANLLALYARKSGHQEDASRAVRLYGSAFRLIKHDVEQPAPTFYEFNIEKADYLRALMLDADLNKNVPSAKLAVQIAFALLKYEEREDSTPGGRWSGHSSVANAIYLQARLTGDQSSLDEAQRHACLAIQELRKRRVYYGPNSVSSLENYEPFELLKRLGKDAQGVVSGAVPCS
jgi:hypothetical protein